MRSVLIVGKGPSAEHAQSWLDSHGEDVDVAVINNALALLAPRCKIKYGFFTHIEAYELMQQSGRHVGQYVSPENDPCIDRCNRDYQLESNRHSYYRHNTCVPFRETLINRVVEGGITHFNTATAAHHWLAKEGYKWIYLIGIDGGTQYARGMDAICEAAKAVVASGTFDMAVTVHRELCSILKNVYESQTVWIRMENVTQPDGSRVELREDHILEENGQ